LRWRLKVDRESVLRLRLFGRANRTYFPNPRLTCNVCSWHIIAACVQGKREKCPTQKLRNLRNVLIYFCIILFICLEDNCAKVCCFVLYLLDMRLTDGDAKFKNEFCNCADCTKGWFYFKVIERRISPLLYAIVT